MTNPVTLSVREITAADVAPLVDYWLTATPQFLRGMGADPAKIPDRATWENMLHEQIATPYTEKKAYCIIWLVNEQPIGHSNVNKIVFGDEAYMHLHVWNAALRGTGYGRQLLEKTIPFFFKNLQLKKLYCEPYAHNPAPNKILPKAGFRFVKSYTTTPGYLNFEQEVNLWEMDRPAN
jgi:[ribosomal protein S5]-alanine N-acetyltransferase